MQMRIFPGQLLEQSAAAVWCMVCVGMWKMCQRFKKNQRKKETETKSEPGAATAGIWNWNWNCNSPAGDRLFAFCYVNSLLSVVSSSCLGRQTCNILKKYGYKNLKTALLSFETLSYYKAILLCTQIEDSAFKVKETAPENFFDFLSALNYLFWVFSLIFFKSISQKNVISW